MKVVAAIVLFFCVAELSNSEELFDTAYEKELDRFVRKTMECRHIPGLTISVVKDSKTWTKGYGIADFSNGRRVDYTTQFLIGSVTESLTMVLLGVLLTEKGLNWDTKVRDIMGPKHKFIDEYRSKETTLKDLLSHRTGLAKFDIGLIAGYSENVTREQLCMKLKFLPQAKPFRYEFRYNNLMYMFLGHVAEKLGGDTWENLLKDKVLLPIGMTSTDLLKKPTDVLKDNIAKPYIFKDNKFQSGTLDINKLYPLEPAGSVLSTAEDMAKYMRFNLNGGTTESGKTLLNPDLLTESFQATSTLYTGVIRPYFPDSDRYTGYGYAWFTPIYRGYRQIAHSGGWFSYITRLWMYPDIKAGIFCNVNGPGLRRIPGYGLRTILYYISDKLMGDEPWLDETTVCDFPPNWRNTTKNAKPQESVGKIDNPSEYTGVYGNNLLPSLNISTKTGDDSVLLFQMNRLGGVLHSTKDKDRFLFEVTSPWEYKIDYSYDNVNPIMYNSTFQRNKGGEVRTIVIEEEVKVFYSKDVSIFDDDNISSQAANLLIDKRCVVARTCIAMLALVIVMIL